MGLIGSNLPFGDFTVFGFTCDPGFVKHTLTKRLGIIPKIFEIGSLGQFYFYSSYGDVSETDEVLVLKLGFLRSTTKSPLTSQQLLVQRLVEPQTIRADRV